MSKASLAATASDDAIVVPENTRTKPGRKLLPDHLPRTEHKIVAVNLHRTSPLRCQTGAQHELECQGTGRPVCIIIECIEIFAYGATCRLPTPVLVPIFASDRTTPAGIRFDLARINRKSLASNEPLRNAVRYDALKEVKQQIAFSEPLIASTRKRQVVGTLYSMQRPLYRR